MVARIHLIVDEREREAFRSRATSEGLTLSEWIRLAARERLEKDRPKRISDVRDLDSFYAERAAAEVGQEPDWIEHLAVIDRSRRGRLGKV